MGVRMSEVAPETPAPESQPAPEASAPEAQPEPQQPVETTDWKAEARKWEQRAKENHKAAQEFERQRKASMTEAERAVVEAEQRGRTAAAQEYGKRLAQTEFQRLAALRNPSFDSAGTLEFIDQSRFVGEDGELDPKVIAKAVERFVPEPAASASPSFDGGARTAPKATNMNDVIRRAAGLA